VEARSTPPTCGFPEIAGRLRAAGAASRRDCPLACADPAASSAADASAPASNSFELEPKLTEIVFTYRFHLNVTLFTTPAQMRHWEIPGSGKCDKTHIGEMSVRQPPSVG
jgi:hypothetical protein